MREKIIKSSGFSLVELMIVVAISSIILTAIYMTFNSQSESYIIQEDVTITNQSLRAAMDMLKQDIQMAGFYTNFEKKDIRLDWDDFDDDDVVSRIVENESFSETESIRPILLARDNIGPNQSDLIVIVMASPDEGTRLQPAEQALKGSKQISLTDLDFDGDGINDLNTTNRRFGILVQQSLLNADFFEVDNIGGTTVSTGYCLNEGYGDNDWIFRTDIIVYRVNNNQLVRKNLGDNNGFLVIAENIENVQFRYQSFDFNWANDPEDFAGGVMNLRAVEVTVLAVTGRADRRHVDTTTYNIGNIVIPSPNDNFRRKVLTCEVKTRNIDL